MATSAVHFVGLCKFRWRPQSLSSARRADRGSITTQDRSTQRVVSDVIDLMRSSVLARTGYPWKRSSAADNRLSGLIAPISLDKLANTSVYEQQVDTLTPAQGRSSSTDPTSLTGPAHAQYLLYRTPSSAARVAKAVSRGVLYGPSRWGAMPFHAYAVTVLDCSATTTTASCGTAAAVRGGYVCAGWRAAFQCSRLRNRHG
jgi:hypothetical protein